MRTIRRLYLYGVAMISLMVVVWGLIGLARSAFAGDAIGGDVTRLAGALALIFVGVPVFLLHWWLAQRSIRQDEEERFARVRAFFLFGALLATLFPVVQNVLALINRFFFRVFAASSNRVIFGYEQTWGDNFIAIVLNGLIAAYIFYVLRQNWDEENVSDAFGETRRLYRFVWMLYGLSLTAFGIQQMLLYLFDLLADAANISTTMLANGLTMTIIGLPIWVFSWRILQRAFNEQDEQHSLLRLIILYAVSLIALLTTLSGAGVILNEIFNVLFSETSSFSLFMDEIRDPLSMALPMGVVWAYYSTILRRENKALPDATHRAGIQRLYTYTLVLIGLSTVFVGVHRFFYTLIDLLPLDDFAEENPILWSRLFRNDLAQSLAMLLVGLPLWLSTWIPINRIPSRDPEASIRIRQSLIRRGYLYLVLFAGIIGLMVSAGMLIFNLLQAALGEPPQDFASLVLELVVSLGLFGLLLWYHSRLLQTDGRLASQALAEKHTDFPVLVLVSEIGLFSEMVVTALQKEAPTLPVVVHVIDQGVPDETLSNAKAVILPASITASPLEAIRLWLQNFSGVRFVIPTSTRGWVWISGNGSSLKNLIQQTVEKVRLLAEGEDIYKTHLSPWMIIGYIAGGVFGFALLLSLFSILADLLF
jgi:hypothetical protein